MSATQLLLGLVEEMLQVDDMAEQARTAMKLLSMHTEYSIDFAVC